MSSYIRQSYELILKRQRKWWCFFDFLVVQMDGIQHKSLDKFPNCHFLLFKDNYQSFNLGGKLGAFCLGIGIARFIVMV